MLGVLPFFHVFAMTVVMNFAIAKAAEILIMPRFVLDDALKLIDKAKPTIMPGVPTLFNAVMQPSEAQELRSLVAEILPVGRRRAAARNQAGVRAAHRVQSRRGLRALRGVAGRHRQSADGPVKAGSIGQPIPQTIVSLRALDDPTKEVPLGEKGEVCIKGPQVMKGYWKKPRETADQFVGDFLRTGDVAIMDEEGFLFIVDRIKDLIICSGYNVYPRRIEEAIYEHPAVEEVTVIGIPDEYRGEAPKAFVKLKAGATATTADLMKHLEPKISTHRAARRDRDSATRCRRR